MSEIPLVDDLKYWRAERADEWVMDRFIRKAEQLTEENKKLKKDFDASKRFYEEVGYQKKSEKLTEEVKTWDRRYTKLNVHTEQLQTQLNKWKEIAKNHTYCVSIERGEQCEWCDKITELKGEENENTKSKD